MSRETLVKAALLALLVTGAVLGYQPDQRFTGLSTNAIGAGLLLFGIVNVLFSPPGTQWVRGITIAATIAALVSNGAVIAIVFVIAWLAWPPAFIVAWALARDTPATTRDPPEGAAAATRARITLAALIGAVAVASLAYRVLVFERLQQTAALFVGIPALLAVVVLFAVSPQSAKGVACKAVTIGLLVSLLFLGEGIMCVAMSAPLFYVVAIAIASTIDRAHEEHEATSPTLLSCLVLLFLVPMSLEGVTGVTTLSRDESVVVSKVVRSSSQEVARVMFERPRFDRVRPLYLRAGFPSPASTRIEQVAGGTRWVIELRGGEMRLDGMEPRTGDLVLELEEERPGLMRWRAVSDGSHMTHFLDWREAVVEWTPIDARRTKVTWTLRYRRGLDPSWYFGPMERYAVGLAAGYLIDAVATP